MEKLPFHLLTIREMGMMMGEIWQLEELAGKRVVLLLCGGNIDPNVLSRVIERGLVADGRLSRFTSVISDRPGGLADLTTQIAAAGASVKQVMHDRAFASSDVSAVNGGLQFRRVQHERLDAEDMGCDSASPVESIDASITCERPSAPATAIP